MTELKAPKNFAERFLLLLGSTKLADRYRQKSNDTFNYILEAEQKAVELARDKGTGWSRAHAAARIVRDRFGKAEASAREAQKIAKEGKDRAEAAIHLLEAHKELVERTIEERAAKERERNGKAADSSQDTDTEAAGSSGAAESSGDEGTPKAA